MGSSSLRGGFLRGETGRCWLSGLLGQGILFPGFKFSEHLRSRWVNTAHGPIQPTATSYCKWSFIGAWPHPLIYILQGPICAKMAELQNCDRGCMVPRAKYVYYIALHRKKSANPCSTRRAFKQMFSMDMERFIWSLPLTFFFQAIQSHGN